MIRHVFTDVDENRDRGQVGIGTLIVFIALVLVAAIAAGVLINTAGFLQSQAESTGQESTDQVANNLQVQSATGSLAASDAASDAGDLTSASILVSLGPGSDPIDALDLTVSYQGPGGTTTLTAAEPGETGGAVEADSTTDVFGLTKESVDGSLADDEYILLQQGDKVTIDIALASGDNIGVISPGESAQLTITTADGSQSTVDLSVPSTATAGSNVQL